MAKSQAQTNQTIGKQLSYYSDLFKTFPDVKMD